MADLEETSLRSVPAQSYPNVVDDLGTPPDGWSFIPTEEATDDPERRRALMQERLALWHPEMTFARVTATDGPYATEGWPEGIWIEVWKTPPDKQAAFNPPLTVSPAGYEARQGVVSSNIGDPS